MVAPTKTPQKISLNKFSMKTIVFWVDGMKVCAVCKFDYALVFAVVAFEKCQYINLTSKKGILFFFRNLSVFHVNKKYFLFVLYVKNTNRKKNHPVSQFSVLFFCCHLFCFLWNIRISVRFCEIIKFCMFYEENHVFWFFKKKLHYFSFMHVIFTDKHTHRKAKRQNGSLMW